MASTISYNSTIKLGVATGGAYTAPTVALGEVTSISFDGVAQSTIEITQLSDAVKKFTAGLLDPGSISLEVNLDQDDATQALLFTAGSHIALLFDFIWCRVKRRNDSEWTWHCHRI